MRSRLRTFWHDLGKTPYARAGLIFLALISLAALSAPLLSPYAYDAIDLEHKLESPSWQHWMGTDGLGRDLHSRILHGARMSLTVGILSALASLVLGTATGLMAGYYRGWVDSVLMRIVDFFYIFPTLLLAILLMLVFGRGFMGIVTAITFSAWIYQARLVRGLTLKEREMAYVEAARALGMRSLPILWRQILPNLIGPVIVSLSLQIPANIMAESFLSFLGLGLQPPLTSWGTLANEGFRAMRSDLHLILFPGLILMLSLIAFHLLGDGLRGTLSRRSRSR